MTHSCDMTSEGLFFRDCIIYVCSTCQPARQNHYYENDYISFLITQHCNIVQRQKKFSHKKIALNRIQKLKSLPFRLHLSRFLYFIPIMRILSYFLFFRLNIVLIVTLTELLAVTMQQQRLQTVISAKWGLMPRFRLDNSGQYAARRPTSQKSLSPQRTAGSSLRIKW